MTRKRRKKKSLSFSRLFLKLIVFLIKIPIFIVRTVNYLVEKSTEEKIKKAIKEKRNSIRPRFEEFKIIKKESGYYNEWKKEILKADSKIGIILGARGTGKTAIGIKLLENFYSKTKRKCFAMGFNEDELPSWINSVSDISNIKNNSFVLIDEGGILFNSRSSMSSANKILSKLILIARHKNISILFISQNSSNLEVNVLRQADFLILKPSSLLQKDFERKIVKNLYEKISTDFKKLKKHKGITYIYSDSFRGFIINPLPSFWKESISKSFK